MNNKLFIMFIVCIIAACSLNLYTLNSQSIRLDESQSLWVAPKTINGILEYIARDVHLPLYHILLHFWIKIFGTQITTTRLLSFLFFLATIPVLYKLAKETSNKNTAMLTVTLFVLSPFVMWYSNETRMYSLFTLTTSLNHLYFLRMLRSKGKEGKLGYIISGIGGVYSHYFFNLMLFVQGLVILIKSMQLKHHEKLSNIQTFHLTKKLIGAFFLGIVIIWASLVPWLLFVNAHGGTQNMQPLIASPTSYNLFTTFINFLFGFQNFQIQAVLISIWPITTIFLFLLFTKRRALVNDSLGYFALVTFLPVVLTFVASYIRPIFLSRYLIMVTPTLFLILSVALLSLSHKISRILIPTLITLLAFLSLYQNLSAQTPVREDYSQVAQTLSEKVTERDIIAVSAPFTVYPIEYTYIGKARITTIPEWSRYESGPIPPFSQQNLEKQINIMKKQYEKMYLVLSYDQGYEKDIQKYMDGHYELLEKREYSPGLQIRVYRFRYDLENLFKEHESSPSAIPKPKLK